MNKDFLSLTNINSVLKSVLNGLHTWVAPRRKTERDTYLCLMQYQSNFADYFFCDSLSEKLKRYNRGNLSVFCSHQFASENPNINKTRLDEIDSVIFNEQNSIIASQAAYLKEIITLSLNLYYCCKDQDNASLAVDNNDCYNGNKDTVIRISRLKNMFNFNPDVNFYDSEQRITLLCVKLYDAFVAPLSDKNVDLKNYLSSSKRYKWLNGALEKSGYFDHEKGKIVEDRVFDFLAIISILALDCSDHEKSTESYKIAVFSFLNIEYHVRRVDISLSNGETIDEMAGRNSKVEELANEFKSLVSRFYDEIDTHGDPISDREDLDEQTKAILKLIIGSKESLYNGTDRKIPRRTHRKFRKYGPK